MLEYISSSSMLITETLNTYLWWFHLPTFNANRFSRISNNNTSTECKQQRFRYVRTVLCTSLLSVQHAEPGTIALALVPNTRLLFNYINCLLFRLNRIWFFAFNTFWPTLYIPSLWSSIVDAAVFIHSMWLQIHRYYKTWTGAYSPSLQLTTSHFSCWRKERKITIRKLLEWFCNEHKWTNISYIQFQL